MTHIARSLLVATVVLLAPLAAGGVGIGAAQPNTPHTLYGDVEIGGEPAPEGTTIEAVIDGEVAGDITVDEEGVYSGPPPEHTGLIVDCTVGSGDVTFELAGFDVEADQTIECTTGAVDELDLTFPDVDGDPGDPGEDPPGDDPPEEEPPEEDPPEDDPGNGDDGDAGNGDDGDDSGSSGGAPGGGGGGGGGGASTGDDGADVDVIGVDDGVTTYIDDVPTGEDVTVDFDGEVVDDGFTVGSITVEHRITPDDYRIEVTDIGTAPPSGVTALEDADPIGYLDVDPIGTDDIDTVEFSFTVEADALPDGASAETVALYHYDEGWEPLETEHVESDGGVHEFVAETDELSAFAIGAATPEAVEPTVVEASLDTTELPAGEAISVDATVENDGSTEERVTVSLTVGDEVRDDLTVTVPGGERVDVTFTVDIDEPGEYAVAVDETAAGDVTVLDESESVETPDADPAVEEQSPGFGVVVAVVATLAAALLARRR